MMTLRALIATVVLGHSIAALAAAQEKPKPPEAPALSQPMGQLRVQVVIARSQGERKISSVPYSFLVSADGRSAQVKMGVEIPVTVNQIPTSEGAKAPFTSFQYRNVGTNLDCSALTLPDGRFQLRLKAENSSVYQGPDGRASTAATENAVAPDRPLFRSSFVDLSPIVRDGDAFQAVASTDPVSGETVKIEVSVTVLK